MHTSLYLGVKDSKKGKETGTEVSGKMINEILRYKRRYDVTITYQIFFKTEHKLKHQTLRFKNTYTSKSEKMATNIASVQRKKC